MTAAAQPRAARPAPPPSPLPDRDSPEARAARLEALEELESDMHDLLNMAGIAFHLIEDTFSDPDTHKELSGGREHTYYVPPRAMDHLMFAGAHTRDMVRRLKDRYLAAMGFGKAA